MAYICGILIADLNSVGNSFILTIPVDKLAIYKRQILRRTLN